MEDKKIRPDLARPSGGGEEFAHEKAMNAMRAVIDEIKSFEKKFRHSAHPPSRQAGLMFEYYEVRPSDIHELSKQLYKLERASFGTPASPVAQVEEIPGLDEAIAWVERLISNSDDEAKKRLTFYPVLEAARRYSQGVLSAVPQWQPIESAPREVEFRCLLAHEYSVITGYWDGYGWRNERSRINNYFTATHWMPLPTPPDGRGEYQPRECPSCKKKGCECITMSEGQKQ